MADLYARPSNRPLRDVPARGAAVSLRPVTRENVLAICHLRTTEEQRSLVGPTAYTVAESVYEPGSILRAIYADDVAVGLAFVETDSGTPHLVRFLIDAAAQGRGFGSEAVTLLLHELRGDRWPALEVTFVPKAGGAQGFWESCGFEDTGRTKDGEPVYVRPL